MNFACVNFLLVFWNFKSVHFCTFLYNLSKGILSIVMNISFFFASSFRNSHFMQMLYNSYPLNQ